MARSTSTSRSTSINDSLSIESVVDTVRKLWKSIEDNSEEIDRTKLKRDIAQTVNRLKGRVEKSLKWDFLKRGAFRGVACGQFP